MGCWEASGLFGTLLVPSEPPAVNYWQWEKNFQSGWADPRWHFQAWGRLCCCSHHNKQKLLVSFGTSWTSVKYPRLSFCLFQKASCCHCKTNPKSKKWLREEDQNTCSHSESEYFDFRKMPPCLPGSDHRFSTTFPRRERDLTALAGCLIASLQYLFPLACTYTFLLKEHT